MDEDEDTQRDLAKMAEIEERNAKMERIRLDKEKVVGSEVKKTVRDGVQIRTYRVAPGADTVYNVRTESEIDREIAEYRKKSRRIYLIWILIPDRSARRKRSRRSGLIRSRWRSI